MNHRKCTIEGCNGYVFSKNKCKYHAAVDALNKPSKRMQKYYEMRNEFMQANPICQVCKQVPSSDLHHRQGRIGKSLYEHFLAVCRPCHSRIERDVEWALSNNYSIKRHTISE